METLDTSNAAASGGRGRPKQQQPGIQMPSQSRDISNERDVVIFKLANNDKNGRVRLPNQNDAIHPEKGTVQRMRLLSGVGVDQIWVTDQKGMDKETIAVSGRELVFEHRVLRVDITDDAALYYLRHHSSFTGYAPNKRVHPLYAFYEYDPKKIAEESLAAEMLEIEMVAKASQQEESFIKKHALYLGIPDMDEYGWPKEPAAIKREYMLAAKRDPKRFQETLGSKVVTISFLIKKAIVDGKIELQGANGITRFAAGAEIAAIPATQNPAEYLTNLAMTNSDEGKLFLQRLEALGQ